MSLPQPYSIREVKPWLNMLVYSPPGVGKTTLLATAGQHPDMSPILVLNHEGGLLSIAKAPNIDVVDIKNASELEEVYWALVNKDKSFAKYKTVGIDSGSELQQLDLEHIARSAFEKDVADKGDKAKRQSVDDLWQEDYGKDTAKLRRLFRWFRDAPFHVIITALSKKIFEKKRKGEGDPMLLEVLPAFTDKLSTSVMGYCDFVWYLYAEDVHDDEGNPTGERVRKMLTQDHGVYRAKTRGPNFAEAIGRVVEKPNLANLYNTLLQAEYNGNTKEKKK